MQEFLLAGLLGTILISACCLNVYEVLRYCWKLMPNMTIRPRLRVMVVVASIFLSHIVNIWLFGFVYYVLHHFNLGTLSGSAVDQGSYTLDIFGCMYYSAVIYTTLGLGDISPLGALRMITGVEALTGFMLLGWTVTFTYLAMEKFWVLPHSKKTH